MKSTEDKYSLKFDEIIRNECPCDNCEHFQKCKVNEWACRSFAKFVLDNYYYKDAVRDPCKGTFNKIFNQKDDDVLRIFVRAFKENLLEDTAQDNKGE
jgi:hypothetical protein